MSNQYSGKVDMKEKAIEQDNLNSYNESVSGKVKPQNQHHNARKEGFARKERNQNN